MTPETLGNSVISQTATFAATPVPTIVLVIIIGLGIWKVLEWRHQAINDRLRDERDALKQRLETASQRDGYKPPPAEVSDDRGPKVTTAVGSVLIGTPAKSAATRVFLPENVTPDFIVNLIYNKTDIHAGAALQPYLGMWMRASGYVQSISDVGSSSVHLSFVPYKEDTIEGVHGNSRQLVHCIFSNNAEVVRVLHKQDHVTVLGKFSSGDWRGVMLSDCELMQKS